MSSAFNKEDLNGVVIALDTAEIDLMISLALFN